MIKPILDSAVFSQTQNVSKYCYGPRSDSERCVLQANYQWPGDVEG